MTDATDSHDRLIGIGLKDPFIRQIAGMAALASTASFAISVLGSGVKAVLILALSLSFGVILIILRTLMNNMYSSFVRQACFVSSTVIMGIFLVFAALLVPVATICWPQAYAAILGVSSCGTTSAPTPAATTPTIFTPVEFPNVQYHPENAALHARVLYRPDRRAEAERIAGALQSAGFQTVWANSDLNELTPPFRGATVLKWTSQLGARTQDVTGLMRLAIPLSASSISVSPSASSFSRGDDFQIDLF
jgi:hypothetical protein